MEEDYRIKGKLAIGLFVKKQDDINSIEDCIYNKSLTTDEYKLIIQECISLLRKNNSIEKLMNILIKK